LKLMNFTGDRVNSNQYRALHQLLRFPKPTYLKGLTPRAEQFVTDRVKIVGIRKHDFEIAIPIKLINSDLVFDKLAVRLTVRIRQTTKTRAIQEAFGIRPDQLEYPLVSDFSLNIKPKSTVLIVGPSGSGKTLLLSAITGRLNKSRSQPGSQIRIEGGLRVPSN